MAPTVLAHPGQHLGADGLPALDLAVTGELALVAPGVGVFLAQVPGAAVGSRLVADDLEGAVFGDVDPVCRTSERDGPVVGEADGAVGPPLAGTGVIRWRASRCRGPTEAAYQ